MKIYLTLLIILLLVGCRSQTHINRIDDTSISRSALEIEIHKLLEVADVTGLAVAVFNDNKVVYSKAFGLANNDTRDSLETDQVFYGASLSKAVFGYLVAGLVEDGVLDLDKPLQQYLDIPIPEMEFEKEWRGFTNLNNDKRYEDITARMCLSHTTGLPNWRWVSRTGEFQPEGKLHFYFDPGNQYSYSGEGIQLLQFVIEHVTGKGLEQLASERIFDPLKMDMTSYLWQQRFEQIYVNGHTVEQKVIPKDPADEAAAAGSMSTTLEDYSKFVQHILTLSAENSNTTELMFKPNIRIYSKKQFGPQSLEHTDENDDVELSYGLGWGLLQSPYGLGAFKEGHGEGFQHYSIIYPERHAGIIILSNSDNAESIFKSLLEISIGDIYTPWKWENYIPYDQKKYV